MPTIKIAYHSSFHTPTEAGVNKLPRSGTSLALNYTDGSSSGLTVTNTTAFPSQLNQSAYAAGDKHGISQDVIKGSGVYTSSTTSPVLTLSGTLGAGLEIKNIKFWGASSVNDGIRQTKCTIGATELTHDARDYGAAAPQTFTLNTSSMPIAMNFSLGAGGTYAYLAYLEIEVGSSGLAPHTRNTTITVNPATPVGSQTMTVNYSDGSSATRALTVVRPIQVQFNSASGTLLVIGNGSNYTGTLDKYTVWDKDPRHDATAAVVLTGTNLSVTAGVAAIGAYGDPLVNGTTYWVVVSENDDSLYALAPLVAG